MWLENKGKLSKSFKFKSFSEAWAFMTRVAFEAEKMNHHPDWFNSYNEVHIDLCTHSEGMKITEKDRQLAERIDKIRSS